MTCVNLDEGLTVQSFTYGPIGLGAAIGRWEPVITVNYPIKKEVTIGVTTSESSGSEVSASEAFTASMNVGVGFWGASVSVGFSAAFESSFKQTVN